MRQEKTLIGGSLAARAPSERTVLARGTLPAMLERRSANVQGRASAAGLKVLMVGTAELFTDARLLVGDKTWVVMPVGRDPTLRRGRLPVPIEQRRRLEDLVEAACHFPVIYSAHEIDPSKTAAEPVARGARTIDDGRAGQLVGAAPPTAQAVARSRQLGDMTEKLGRAARKVLTVAGAAAVLPVAAAGALAVGAAGAVGGLDPVLFGVVTASGRAVPGEIGAWMIIAQWTW